MITNLRLRESGLTWSTIDGEVVALEACAGEYLTANETGTVLWEALARGATRTDLVVALCETYGIDTARAGADVDAYIEELAARGLLEQ